MSLKQNVRGAHNNFFLVIERGFAYDYGSVINDSNGWSGLMISSSLA